MMKIIVWSKHSYTELEHYSKFNLSSPLSTISPALCGEFSRKKCEKSGMCLGWGKTDDEQKLKMEFSKCKPMQVLLQYDEGITI